MPKAVLIPAWKRLVAFIIDILIVDFLLLYPFTDISEKAFSAVRADFLIFQGSLVALILSVSAIYILYFTFFEWILGQTIGKMFIRSTSANLNNKQMNFWQALGRNLFLIPVVPFVFLWVLDPIFIIWKGRSLSEIFTKTKTIEGEKWLEKQKQ